MGLRPLIEINLVVDEIALQKFLDVDSFSHNSSEIMLDQVSMRKVILIFDDVVYHHIERLYLIIFQSDLNGRVIGLLIFVLDPQFVE